MERIRLSDFHNGWIVGNFSPSVLQTSELEVCIKHFAPGDLEAEHFQKTAIEVTFVIQGSCKISNEILNEGEGLIIQPGVPANFEALTNCTVVGIKWPSSPNDKMLTAANIN